MDFAKVSVEIRNQSGKGPARRSRSSGKLPAVLYGHKVEPISLVLDPVELTHALDKERKRNTVFTLDVKNAAKSEAVMAMIREVQIDPMSRRPVHVDFIRVSMDEEVKVSVPLVLTGIPVGVTNGGNLHLSHHNLPIAAKPDAIPTKIELAVTALDIGDALHAVDLKLPEWPSWPRPWRACARTRPRRRRSNDRERGPGNSAHRAQPSVTRGLQRAGRQVHLSPCPAFGGALSRAGRHPRLGLGRRQRLHRRCLACVRGSGTCLGLQRSGGRVRLLWPARSEGRPRLWQLGHHHAALLWAFGRAAIRDHAHGRSLAVAAPDGSRRQAATPHGGTCRWTDRFGTTRTAAAAPCDCGRKLARD